jgi:formylglycine-generating enzyme required for sulfatase activity
MGGGENNEQSQLMQISYAYWIGRYPVTVAQFAAFVADAGYTDQRWWGSEIASRWLKETRAINPGEWNKQCRHPNRPVTQVSWFEASAYCAWLDARLRALERDPLPPDCQIRLPTEAEWARAARGKDPLPYPWGYQDWDEQRANVQEGNIGHATPVGIYPQGATASGLYDLAGNIWEWTQSGAEDQPGKSFSPADNAGVERRVLCGGSWSDPRSAARCASRGVDFTIARDAAIGFRVVVSLIKPGQ